MKDTLKDRIFTGVITGVLIVIAFISMIPLLNVLATSLSSRVASQSNVINLLPKVTAEKIGVTFDSWMYILTDKGLWRSFFITVVTTAIGTFLALAITALTAYPLSKQEFKLGKWIMVYIVGTMIFKAPTVPYFLTIRELGLANNYLVLILPHILSAYNLAIMRTSFKGFPKEIEEAARVDGCGPFAILWRIVLPSSKAVLATVGLFYAVVIWNQYQHPMMFITGNHQEMYPLQMKVSQLINAGGDFAGITAISTANYTTDTLSAATVIFAILPIILVYPWLQKYFVKGAMLGSVKG